MLYRIRYSRIVLCAIALLVLACAASGTQVTKQLAPGVTLYQDINTDPAQALVVNCAVIDLANPAAAVRAALGKDVVHVEDWTKGRETIGSLTARKGALLGVNADFFPFTGDPLGVCVVNGELVSEPGANRVCLALRADRTAFFDNPRLDAKLTLANGVSRQIDGINRSRETNQVIAYTDTFGAISPNKYKGTEIVLQSDELPVRIGRSVNLTVTEVYTDSCKTPIPEGGMVISAGGPAAWFLKENLKPGDKLSVRFDIKSAVEADWTGVEQAVGGGPWLLRDGGEFIDSAAEGFKGGFVTGRHPRTAVGLTADNKLLIVTVDGRQAISRGISLKDLSALMKRLGAVHAINLDGGGSTCLSYRGLVLNCPSDGPERLVANALLVFAEEPKPEELPGLCLAGAAASMASGQGAQLTLACGDGSQPLTDEQLDRVVWGATGGVGFVNQKGYFVPGKLRKGSVKAVYGSQVVGSDVAVVAGLPSVVNIKLAADKTDPARAAITVTVDDAGGNRLSGRQVTLQVTSGRADIESGTTDDKGQFIGMVTWDADAADRSVRATVGDIVGEAKP